MTHLHFFPDSTDHTPFTRKKLRKRPCTEHVERTSHTCDSDDCNHGNDLAENNKKGKFGSLLSNYDCQ